MSKQYEKTGRIMNEHDYILDCTQKNGMVREEVAKRAARIARLRGIMQAAKGAGCFGTYDNARLTLKKLLDNLNKRALTGKHYY